MGKKKIARTKDDKDNKKDDCKHDRDKDHDKKDDCRKDNDKKDDCKKDGGKKHGRVKALVKSMEKEGRKSIEIIFSCLKALVLKKGSRENLGSP